jgi:hypothetical protein
LISIVPHSTAGDGDAYLQVGIFIWQLGTSESQVSSSEIGTRKGIEAVAVYSQHEVVGSTSEVRADGNRCKHRPSKHKSCLFIVVVALQAFGGTLK